MPAIVPPRRVRELDELSAGMRVKKGRVRKSKDHVSPMSQTVTEIRSSGKYIPDDSRLFSFVVELKVVLCGCPVVPSVNVSE